MEHRRAIKIANWVLLPAFAVVEILWWIYGDLANQTLDGFTGIVLALCVVSLGGAVHGFVTRDRARWRWLVAFVPITAALVATAYYLLSRADVDVIHAFVIAVAWGVLFLFVVLTRPSRARPASS